MVDNLRWLNFKILSNYGGKFKCILTIWDNFILYGYVDWLLTQHFWCRYGKGYGQICSVCFTLKIPIFTPYFCYKFPYLPHILLAYFPIFPIFYWHMALSCLLPNKRGDFWIFPPYHMLYTQNVGIWGGWWGELVKVVCLNASTPKSGQL